MTSHYWSQKYVCVTPIVHNICLADFSITDNITQLLNQLHNQTDSTHTQSASIKNLVVTNKAVGDRSLPLCVFFAETRAFCSRQPFLSLLFCHLI